MKEPPSNTSPNQAPKHIAFIMDGNRRHAKSLGLSPKESYQHGIENMGQMVEKCIEIGVPYATFFAFSTENWGRSQGEINTIMQVAEAAFGNTGKINNIIKLGAKIKFVGNTEMFSSSIQQSMLSLENSSKENNKITVQICASYSGKSDITHAVEKIAQAVQQGRLTADEITQQIISSNLQTNPTPDPDILIRTGNEQRISNFLLWQISYCELFFSSKMWPVFNKQDLEEIVKEFNIKSRRYGKF